MEKEMIYQVDAFTNEAFKGNPAGVMILEKEIKPERMQKIAMEMNLSETAFVVKKDEGYDIRFFTPIQEVPLCGHASLASAHIIYESNLVQESESIQFNSKGGLLNISKVEEGIKMIFPLYKNAKIKTVENFSDVMGFEPLEMFESEYGWKIAIANNESDIVNTNPSFQKMKENQLGHLMITSKSEDENIDFVVRCFAPDAGIDEDPVTGSAQCALVPLWNLKMGKNQFGAKQLSKRTGLLKLELHDSNIEIIGNSVTVFKAELFV